MVNRNKMVKRAIQEAIKEMISKGLTLKEMEEEMVKEIDDIIYNPANSIYYISRGIIEFKE